MAAPQPADRQPPAGDPAPPRPSPGRVLRDVLVPFVVSKLIVVALLVFFYYYTPHPVYQEQRFELPEKSLSLLHVPFSNWDGNHYLWLARFGYADVQRDTRTFFPLYPSTVFLLHFVTAGNFYAAAFVSSTIFSFLALLYVYLYSLHYLPAGQAWWVVAATLCFPTAFFLTVFYSEGLFLALLFGFLYHYIVRRDYAAPVLAALIPLARGQGFFLFGGFLVYLAWKLVRERKLAVGYEAANVLGFGLGTGAYFLVLWLTTGDPLEGIRAQQELFVFKNSVANLFNPLHFYQYMARWEPVVFAFTNGLADKAFIVFMLLAFVFVARAGVALHVLFYLVLVYCPAAMGEGGGFMRYALLPFPILVISYLQQLSGAAPRRLLVGMLLAVFLLFQVLLIYRFATNQWVG